VLTVEGRHVLRNFLDLARATEGCREPSAGAH